MMIRNHQCRYWWCLICGVVLTSFAASSSSSSSLSTFTPFHGPTPSSNDVDQWMHELGCSRTVVGKTIQDRDIVLYQMEYSSSYVIDEEDASRSNSKSDDDEEDVTTNGSSKNILFLSLVHGNEPMGLHSLLLGAQRLAEKGKKRQFLRSSSSSSATTIRDHTTKKVVVQRLYFIPIVNVDAYTLNIDDQLAPSFGCQRANLRNTCEYASIENISIPSCPITGMTGVDLNRNYPIHWEKNVHPGCSYQNHGSAPLSEPETQTIARVVNDYNVTAALSFHSLKSVNRGWPLLIHPYASDQALEDMFPPDVTKFRDWSRTMTQHESYHWGTAAEAIQYTAGGSFIDWMYESMNATAFVVEAVPPCDGRFCSNGYLASAKTHVPLMEQFVDLVATNGRSGAARIIPNHPPGFPTTLLWRMIGMVVVLWYFGWYRKTLCCNHKYCHEASTSLRQLVYKKEKDGPD